MEGPKDTRRNRRHNWSQRFCTKWKDLVSVPCSKLISSVPRDILWDFLPHRITATIFTYRYLEGLTLHYGTPLLYWSQPGSVQHVSPKLQNMESTLSPHQLTTPEGGYPPQLIPPPYTSVYSCPWVYTPLQTVMQLSGSIEQGEN